MHFDLFRSARGPKRILIAAILITCILIVLCPVLVSCAQLIAKGQADNPDNSGNNGGSSGNGGINYTSLPVASSDVYAKGSLLVVNDSTPIQSYPEDSQLLQIYGENKSSSYKIKTAGMKLRIEALDAFNDMLDAYFAQTNDGSVIITSAYRTEAEQAAINPSKAGHSDHHLALSVALKLNDNSNVSELPADHWLYLNGYQYGYVQRYPEGKEESTGVSEYYNCLRYVGIPHATYMHENSLSLEEYVTAVKRYTYDGEHLKVTAGGVSYEIYYVPANLSGSEDAITTLPVPAGLEYSYSGNNTDGFIVTVKLPAA